MSNPEIAEMQGAPIMEAAIEVFRKRVSVLCRKSDPVGRRDQELKYVKDNVVRHVKM